MTDSPPSTTKTRLLDDLQIRSFHTFGYLDLPGWFSTDEATMLSDLFDNLVARSGPGPLKPGEIAKVQQLELAPQFLPFLDDDRITGAIDELVGSDCIYKGANMISRPKPTRWHRDSTTPLRPTVKISMYLDPVDEDSGALIVLPGTHHPDASNAYEEAFGNELDRLERDIPGATVLPSSPGDAQFFWMPLWHSTWGAAERRRQIQVFYEPRPASPFYSDFAWHADLAGRMFAGDLWKNGYRLFSDHFIETADDRRLRKVQPYLDAGLNDPSRPAPTEAQLLVSRAET
jgi:Phytanoyl-CoA dioxygenase (PhyH)